MAENGGLTPERFWLMAAQWGSYITGGDPGACMYGFDETGTVQNEAHRADSIAWLDEHCRDGVFKRERENTPGAAAELAEDLGEIDQLIAYLRTTPSALAAADDVDDGPHAGYRRGGRKVMLAEYDERQKKREDAERKAGLRD